jgi:ABC-type multidrug transport system fused ATPase/permease subunit
VLSNANLRIKSGERVLIEGPSGGGKTTFSKLLTGELRPTSGTILVDGVDIFSVSESEWRRRIAASPQFHENYLFSNTFGFNVDPKSLRGEMSAEAREVCRELGLDGLIEKMPSQAAQLLGETGWQLSHGERSRVFIARSLLQGAKLLVFDESFGALDPESLARAIECVRKRAPTLLVIAHT